jgi:2-C-methyl-D-erythritol 2,4-cyclodiphosphate synthase
MRVGIGYDAHRLAEGRLLVLGGMTIDFEKGLEGHSDADVLTHAVIDALLGAAGLGDIGTIFPDTEPRFKNIRSLFLLEETRDIIKKAGYSIVNVDAVIIAERPKLSPHKTLMAHNIALSLGIEASAVNVKATTEEGMGFTGCGQGIAAQAVCILNSE